MTSDAENVFIWWRHHMIPTDTIWPLFVLVIIGSGSAPGSTPAYIDTFRNEFPFIQEWENARIAISGPSCSLYGWVCNEVVRKTWIRHGLWFNIKTSSYQYRESHCGVKTVVRSSYRISYISKMSSLYWFSPLKARKMSDALPTRVKTISKNRSIVEFKDKGHTYTIWHELYIWFVSC